MKAKEISRIWQVNPDGAQRRYVIRREHDLVVLLKEKIPAASRELLDALLDHVERTVPVDKVWLDVTEQGVPALSSGTEELVSAAQALVRLMEKGGLGLEEAVTQVTKMEPFDQLEDLESMLLSKKGKPK